MIAARKVTVLAGGVGAAKLLAGMQHAFDAASITALVNVGDDVELHGLHVSPDLDTVTYTMATAVNPDTGWGLADESWNAMDALERFAAVRPSSSAAGATWFRLGDRDLATHLYRTQRLAEGAPLSTVTAEITMAFGIASIVTPVTDDPLRTKVVIAGEGEIDFQDYFVRRRHAVPVTSVRLAGAERARPAPGVLDAIAEAEAIVVAPSNPIVSIAPVLAVQGLRDAVIARRDRVVAISPIIAGAALKGPADRLLVELGHESSVIGVAGLYTEIASVLVIDNADAAHTKAVEAKGMRCVVTDTIMSSAERAGALAKVAVASVGVEV